jgi:hypothetical protein
MFYWAAQALGARVIFDGFAQKFSGKHLGLRQRFGRFLKIGTLAFTVNLLMSKTVVNFRQRKYRAT